MERRNFLKNTSLAAAGVAFAQTPFSSFASGFAKKRIALIGTGHRGTGFWGDTVVKNFSDVIEFVGLCDKNVGRVNWAKERMKVQCPTFTDFETMMKTVKPEIVIVTTMDSTHDEFIVKAMEMGADVITEKPMTTDEIKCNRVLEAERKTGKKVTVAFNYRHGPHMMKIKELLANNRVGRITSVDFNWMLNVYHGADYFRRWHGHVAKSGSLWVHKATHHFDLLNWWLNSEPVEVTAYGELEHYGKNNSFRGVKCRGCEHKSYCKFYLDITKDEWLNSLYVKNEQHDGYLRDGCVWRKEIDIWGKMSAQIKYANGVTVNYSLTTYSPYEGRRIAFNGFNGRLESWQDIPYLGEEEMNQEQRHAVEMSQDKDAIPGKFREIMVMDNFKKEHEMIKVPQYAGGHGGGDQRMQHRIFKNPADNPYNILAGTREGAMSLLIGVAARKSIQQKNRPVQISELTDLKPLANGASNMKQTMKNTTGIFLAIVTLCSFIQPNEKQTRVYLIGDSTIANKEIKAYPETGWGMPFSGFFDTTISVDNRAKNGRSTRTFIEEGLWQPVIDNLKEGDYVFIQFGHNDEVETKKSFTTKEQFTANLARFVMETRAKKGFPVLLTPVARRRFDSTGRIVGTHDEYSALVRSVAKQLNVPFIDLDKKSQALLQSLGVEGSKLLFNHLVPGQHPNYPDGKIDDTHFSELGARKMATIVLAEIRGLKLNLADHIYSAPAKK